MLCSWISKKAFDTVDHEILLQKLTFYGIMSNKLDFFKSYLTNRSQFCQIRGFKSPIGEVLSGVPRGSILGPLLFIIYMNDFPHCIENGHVTIYDDDTSTSCEVKSVHDITVKMIPDLVKRLDWLKSSKLSLNMIKPEFMIIGSTQNVLKFSDLLAIRIGHQLKKRVAHVKYLANIHRDRRQYWLLLNLSEVEMNICIIVYLALNKQKVIHPWALVILQNKWLNHSRQLSKHCSRCHIIYQNNFLSFVKHQSQGMLKLINCVFVCVFSATK